MNTQQYIQTQSKFWFEKYSKYIPTERTLKIGNGLGYVSELIRPLAKELTILDVEIFSETVNKNQVQIYDGYPIPYPDKSFDTTILIYTLHHIPNNIRYFQEIMRVTNKRIILLEETFNNIFQKIHLYYRDWRINKKAGQTCKLFWDSYFSRKELNKLIKKENLVEVYRYTKKHKSYFKELLILDIKR